MSKDILIPLVFPDYKIAIEIKKTKVDILPWFEFDDISTPNYKDKISNLGHAGVLFIDGQSGTTKYFEYGRYDSQNLGLVVKARNLSNVKISNGKIDQSSLSKTLGQISDISGQSGRIEGVYIEVAGAYSKMLDYALFRKSQNGNPNRVPYDLTSNSCIHFVKKVAEAAGIDTPWMIDPRPNSYIGEFRDEYADLDYDPATKKVTIETSAVYR